MNSPQKTHNSLPHVYTFRVISVQGLLFGLRQVKPRERLRSEPADFSCVLVVQIVSNSCLEK